MREEEGGRGGVGRGKGGEIHERRWRGRWGRGEGKPWEGGTKHGLRL